MSSVGAALARGRSRQQCARRSQPQERREVARAEDARRQGRAAQNALKHGMRAQKYVLLPQEDAAEFAALETAIVAELAPDGVLQTLLARRVAVAAWRLERADRMEAEVLEFRSYEDANAGLALIRDGNATRCFDTLMRYRSAAMAEFWRALRAQGAPGRAGCRRRSRAGDTLQPACRAGARARAAAPTRAPRARRSPRTNEPEPLMAYLLPEPPMAGPALHEPAVPAMPNEPERHPAKPHTRGRMERRRDPPDIKARTAVQPRRVNAGIAERKEEPVRLRQIGLRQLDTSIYRNLGEVEVAGWRAGGGGGRFAVGLGGALTGASG